MHTVLGWLVVLISAVVTNVCCHLFPQEITSQPVNSEIVAGSLWHSMFKQFGIFCTSSEYNTLNFILTQLGKVK